MAAMKHTVWCFVHSTMRPNSYWCCIAISHFVTVFPSFCNFTVYLLFLLLAPLLQVQRKNSRENKKLQGKETEKMFFKWWQNAKIYVHVGRKKYALDEKNLQKNMVRRNIFSSPGNNSCSSSFSMAGIIISPHRNTYYWLNVKKR